MNNKTTPSLQERSEKWLIKESLRLQQISMSLGGGALPCEAYELIQGLYDENKRLTDTRTNELMYRLLRNGDVITDGDEALLDDCNTWEKMPFGSGKTVGETWMIGQEYVSGFYQPVRRKKPDAN